MHGVERMAEVARAIDSPVMADESAWNSHDVVDIIERRAAQIVSIYTTKPGGLYRAMEVAAVCRAAGIICNVNGSAELGIGSLANVALAAAAPAVTLPSVFPVSTPASAQRGQVGGIYYKDDIRNIWPFSRNPAMIERGQTFFDRWGALGVFLGHFFGPVRAVIPVVAGMYAVPQWQFQLANITSAFIWAAGVIAPAYFGLQYFLGK